MHCAPWGCKRLRNCAAFYYLMSRLAFYIPAASQGCATLRTLFFSPRIPAPNTRLEQRLQALFDLHFHQPFFVQFTCREWCLLFLISVASPVVRRDCEKFADWTGYVP